MQQLDSIAELRGLRAHWRSQKQSCAFVPTMGNLHDGHLRLVEHAKTRADKVVVSIFVNPMQFGAHEDLDRYPRTLNADKEALVKTGADAVFVPSVAEVYPRGVADQTVVSVPHISSICCGKSRPGHFEGVATVVCKLFNMVQPDVAVFGKKDYQQLKVIRLMTKDLCLPVDIIGVDTVREPSGLAMSSRNGYLTAEQRQQASIIYQSLQKLAEVIQQRGDLDRARASIISQWQAMGIKVDYLDVRRQQDLMPMGSEDRALVILAAAYCGNVRLIDNLEINRS